MMRYCHLSIHVMSHLFEWRWAAFESTTDATDTTTNGRLQFTAGINNWLLLLGCIGHLCAIWLLLHSNLTRRAIRPWECWIEILIVIAHSIVWWKPWIWWHISLIWILTVMMHLLARIQMITIRIVAMHIWTHVWVRKVWSHAFAIICTHCHFVLFC